MAAADSAESESEPVVRCEWKYETLDRPRMKGSRVRELMTAIRRDFHMELVRNGGDVERARTKLKTSTKEFAKFARTNDHPKMFEMAVAYPPIAPDEWETIMAFIRVQEAIDEGLISEEDGNGLRTMHVLTRRNSPEERVDLRVLSIPEALAKVRGLSSRAAANSGTRTPAAAATAVSKRLL